MEISTKIPIQKLIDNLEEFYLGFAMVPQRREETFRWKEDVSEADGFKIRVEYEIHGLQSYPHIKYTIKYLAPMVIDPDGEIIYLDGDDFERMYESVHQKAILELEPYEY